VPALISRSSPFFPQFINEIIASKPEVLSSLNQFSIFPLVNHECHKCFLLISSFIIVSAHPLQVGGLWRCNSCFYDETVDNLATSESPNAFNDRNTVITRHLTLYVLYNYLHEFILLYPHLQPSDKSDLKRPQRNENRLLCY